MKDVPLPIPLIGFIAGTRVLLGVGIGLLISRRMSCSKRRALGSVLVATGALTTIPVAWMVFGRRHDGATEGETVT